MPWEVRVSGFSTQSPVLGGATSSESREHLLNQFVNVDSHHAPRSNLTATLLHMGKGVSHLCFAVDLCVGSVVSMFGSSVLGRKRTNKKPICPKSVGLFSQQCLQQRGAAPQLRLVLGPGRWSRDGGYCRRGRCAAFQKVCWIGGLEAFRGWFPICPQEPRLKHKFKSLIEGNLRWPLGLPSKQPKKWGPTQKAHPFEDGQPILGLAFSLPYFMRFCVHVDVCAQQQCKTLHRSCSK